MNATDSMPGNERPTDDIAPYLVPGLCKVLGPCACPRVAQLALPGVQGLHEARVDAGADPRGFAQMPVPLGSG